MNLRTETADHALGRSRGGLGTKIHQPSDGNGYPLVLLIGPGQAGDSPMSPVLMAALSVPRVGSGRRRTRASAIRCSETGRTRRERTASTWAPGGIETVIAEPDDQKRHRRRRGSRGGRPVGVDQEKYKGCNVVERPFCAIEQWCGLANCYDKLALAYRAGVMLSVCTWLRHLTN